MVRLSVAILKLPNGNFGWTATQGSLEYGDHRNETASLRANFNTARSNGIRTTAKRVDLHIHARGATHLVIVDKTL